MLARVLQNVGVASQGQTGVGECRECSINRNVVWRCGKPSPPAASLLVRQLFPWDARLKAPAVLLLKLGMARKPVTFLSRVRLFVTPWSVAHQAPLSMGFSRQGYWSGLPFPSPGDLPNPGIEPGSLMLQADALPSEPPGKPRDVN